MRRCLMRYITMVLVLTLSLHAISKQSIKEHAREFTNYPSTILAIAGVESSYCKNVLGDDGKSLGCMQIQVPTALFIAKKDSSLAWLSRIPRKTLETLLLRNDALSIEIACKLFEYHRVRHGYFGAVSRYNGGANNKAYYNKVQKEIRNK